MQKKVQSQDRTNRSRMRCRRDTQRRIWTYSPWITRLLTNVLGDEPGLRESFNGCTLRGPSLNAMQFGIPRVCRASWPSAFCVGWDSEKIYNVIQGCNIFDRSHYVHLTSDKFYFPRPRSIYYSTPSSTHPFHSHISFHKKKTFFLYRFTTKHSRFSRWRPRWLSSSHLLPLLAVSFVDPISILMKYNPNSCFSDITFM